MCNRGRWPFARLSKAAVALAAVALAAVALAAVALAAVALAAAPPGHSAESAGHVVFVPVAASGARKTGVAVIAQLSENGPSRVDAARASWFHDYRACSPDPRHVPMLWSPDSVADLDCVAEDYAGPILVFNELHDGNGPRVAPWAACDAFLAVAAARPLAQLIAPAVWLWPGHDDDGLAWLERFLSSPCLGYPFAGFALHVYGGDMNSIDTFAAFLAEFGYPGAPIWITEFNTCNFPGGASELATVFAQLTADPRVDRFAWFAADRIPDWLNLPNPWPDDCEYWLFAPDGALTTTGALFVNFQTE